MVVIDIKDQQTESHDYWSMSQILMPSGRRTLSVEWNETFENEEQFRSLFEERNGSLLTQKQQLSTVGLLPTISTSNRFLSSTDYSGRSGMSIYFPLAELTCPNDGRAISAQRDYFIRFKTPW